MVSQPHFSKTELDLKTHKFCTLLAGIPTHEGIFLLCVQCKLKEERLHCRVRPFSASHSLCTFPTAQKANTAFLYHLWSPSKSLPLVIKNKYQNKDRFLKRMWQSSDHRHRFFWDIWKVICFSEWYLPRWKDTSRFLGLSRPRQQLLLCWYREHLWNILGSEWKDLTVSRKRCRKNQVLGSRKGRGNSIEILAGGEAGRYRINHADAKANAGGKNEGTHSLPG